MSVALTIATTDYDHFRDFRLGLVRAEGIAATWLTLCAEPFSTRTLGRRAIFITRSRNSGAAVSSAFSIRPSRAIRCPG